MKFLFATILIFIFSAANSYLFSQSPPIVLITYYSQSGHTKAMAEAIAKGVDTVEGVDYIVKSIEETTEKEVLNADAIIIGSPVYNANVAPQVQEFINSWPFEGRPLKDKIGAVFVSGGGFSIGEEAVMFSLIRSLMIHGLIIVGGDELEAAFGASAITGELPFLDKNSPSEQFLLKARGLGKRVAEVVLIHDGVRK